MSKHHNSKPSNIAHFGSIAATDKAQAARMDNVRPEDKGALLRYFRQLSEEKERRSLENFSNVWKRLPYHNLDNQDLVEVLRDTANAARDELIGPPNNDFKRWFLELIPIWEDLQQPFEDTARMTAQIRNHTSFAMLGIMPKGCANARLERRIRMEFNEMSQTDTAQFIRGLAMLGRFPNPGTIEAMETRVNSKFDHAGGIPNYTGDNAATIVWACAILHSLAPSNGDTYERIARRFFYEMRNGSLKTLEFGTVSGAKLQDAALWFDETIGRPLHVNTRLEDSSSRFEATLYDYFRMTDLRTRMVNPHLGILNKKTDFAFAANASGKLIYFEADGPYHFVIKRNKMKALSGNTSFQTRLAHKLYPGTTIIRLPHFVFRAALNHKEEAMPLLLRNLVAEAGKSGNACMTVSYDKAIGFCLDPL